MQEVRASPLRVTAQGMRNRQGQEARVKGREQAGQEAEVWEGPSHSGLYRVDVSLGWRCKEGSQEQEAGTQTSH